MCNNYGEHMFSEKISTSLEKWQNVEKCSKTYIKSLCFCKEKVKDKIKKNFTKRIKYLKSMRLCKLILKNTCPYFSHECKKMIVLD